MSDERLSLARDVREGLTGRPKRLPARLFYDAAGSELFERITRLPEYYLTRTELAILERHAPEMIATAGAELTVIELGSGSGYKTRVLLREVLARQGAATYYPVDVSAAALEMAERALRAELPGLEVVPLQGRYRAALKGIKARPERKLMLFLGSSIGNFDPPDSAALLRDLRAALSPEDALLLGTDLRKDPALLLPAYDDAQGVTALFNKNVLARINRELGGRFDPGTFRHVALWNTAASRVEMHLESQVDQVVRIEALELDVPFDRGERLHTESSYKYTRSLVEQMLAAGGFSLERAWRDGRGWFEVSLARARASR